MNPLCVQLLENTPSIFPCTVWILILHIETFLNSLFFFFLNFIINRLGQYQRKPETDTYEPESIKTVEGVKKNKEICKIGNNCVAGLQCSENLFSCRFEWNCFLEIQMYLWLLLLVASGSRIYYFFFISWNVAENNQKRHNKGEWVKGFKRRLCLSFFFWF